MRKMIYAVAAAAAVAAALVMLPSFSPQVQAHGPVFGVKGDRVDERPIGDECSQREWPYFEAGCLRDPRRPFGQARQVRIIPLDRLPALDDSTAVASR
jgi:hypothetical protein